MDEPLNSPQPDEPQGTPAPLPPKHRRILGVLMEKARTTPDAYPLSLNGLVTGCNQKSNRYPLMNLTSEQVEDEVIAMREAGVIAEVHGGGRVPKYRHYGYDYLGVKGAEAAIMTELLLRGEQTAGDLRGRASRFEPIADLGTLGTLLTNLIDRGLVVALTPAGRGQVFTHNLYLPQELEQLKAEHAGGSPVANPHPRSSTNELPAGESHSAVAAAKAAPPASAAAQEEFEALREEVVELRMLVEQLTDRLDRLES